VELNGALCRCGRSGCLETVASGRAIAKCAGYEFHAASAAATSDQEKQTWRSMLAAARDGQPQVLQAFTQAAAALAKATEALVTVVDPQMVVFGGRVMEAQEFIMPVVRAIVSETVATVRSGALRLEVASDALEKSLAGAAHIALRSYLFSKV